MTTYGDDYDNYYPQLFSPPIYNDTEGNSADCIYNNNKAIYGDDY